MRRRSPTCLTAAVAMPVASLAAVRCGNGGRAGGAQAGADGLLTVARASVPPQVGANTFEFLPTVYTLSSFMGTLLDYDASKGGKWVLGGEILRPGLAESWGANDDNTSYTLKLRRGAKRRTGDELDAEDVLWSFRRMLSERTSLAAGVLMPSAHVDTDKPVEKVDAYTVRYNVTSSSAVSLANLACPVLGIFDSVALITRDKRLNDPRVRRGTSPAVSRTDIRAIPPPRTSRRRPWPARPLASLVEVAPVAALCGEARHGHSRALLSARPVTDPREHLPQLRTAGYTGDPTADVAGCVLADRRPIALDRCTVPPSLLAPGHKVACLRAAEVPELLAAAPTAPLEAPR